MQAIVTPISKLLVRWDPGSRPLLVLVAWTASLAVLQMIEFDHFIEQQCTNRRRSLVSTQSFQEWKSEL